MDLLRLLALGNGQVVRSVSLMDKLWPTVSADRARASLRTATSHIRRAIGAQHVLRRPDGLLLQGAWVDTHAFVHGVRRVQQAVREGRASDVVTIALATDALYRGDFHAHDDDSDWALTERNHLVRSRRAMLTEAADAALETGQPREALDFAQSAVALDRTVRGGAPGPDAGARGARRDRQRAARLRVLPRPAGRRAGGRPVAADPGPAPAAAARLAPLEASVGAVRA